VSELVCLGSRDITMNVGLGLLRWFDAIDWSMRHAISFLFENRSTFVSLDLPSQALFYMQPDTIT
jgi:hypothetical protein